MVRFALTEDDVRFVIEHPEDTYPTDGALVYQATLPDGRHAKVRVLNEVVRDAFTFR